MMLIRVCQWHPKYFGRRKLIGFRLDLTRLRPRQTGGMCRTCAIIFRAIAIERKQERVINGREAPTRTHLRAVRAHDQA